MVRTASGLISAFLILGTFSLPGSASADDSAGDPGNLLKTRRLTASGWVYVLDTEASFHSKVIDARSLYQDWSTARGRVVAVEQEAGMIQDATAQTEMLKQNIAQLRQQMQMMNNVYVGRRNAAYQRMQTQQISAEINQEQMAFNQMNQQLSQLKKDVAKPQDKKKLDDEAGKRRESLHDAVKELTTLADSINQSYRELHQDKDVESALATLGHGANAKLKLGPSREFLADSKILLKLQHELALGGSPVAGSAKAKGAHHSKSGTPPKRKYVQPTPDPSANAFGDF